MNSKSRTSVAILFLIVVSSTTALAETINDTSLNFTLKLPPGFAAHQAFIDLTPDLAHAFVYGDPEDDQLDIVLFIRPMKGAIGRTPLDPSGLPPGSSVRLFSTRWGEFEVDAFEVPELIDGVEFITFNVQIPLRRRAIQVSLAGAADRRAELVAILPLVLNGLKGESNWMASAVMPESTTGYLVLAGAILVGGVVLLWLTSRKAPKGTVLLLGFIMLFSTLTLDEVAIREIRLISGVMRMLGVLAIILGSIEVIRRRRPK